MLKNLAKKDFKKIFKQLDTETIEIKASSIKFEALLPAPDPLALANYTRSFGMHQTQTPAYIDVPADDAVLQQLTVAGVVIKGDGWSATIASIGQSTDPLLVRLTLQKAKET